MPKRNRKMNNLVAVRLDEQQLEALNEWRRKQLDPPTRAEAIRRLMEIGLAHEQEAGAKKARKP
jgi:chorismate mutase